MIQPATKIVDQEPAAPAGAIDLGQLARMTFGDRSLEREVLQLFDRQAAILIERMRGTNAAAIPATTAKVTRYASPAARPRRRMPRRRSHSTNGLSASARKSEIRIHTTTCLAVQITHSTTPTTSRIQRIARIVRGRK